MVNPNLPLRERFELSIRKEASGCWIWTASRLVQGYGRIMHEGRVYRAHRLSWWLYKGEHPKGQLNHTCHNPACVNPDHLYEGSQYDNMQDRKARGYRPEGRPSRFTAEVVQKMRESGKGPTELAVEHGVSQSYMSRLLRGERGPDALLRL